MRVDDLPSVLRLCADQLPVDHSTTVAEAIQALSSLTGSEHAHTRITCCFELSRYYFVSGASRDGLDYALKGVEIAQAIGDRAATRKLLTAYGSLQTDSLNVPAAIEAFSSALDLCEALNAPEQYATVWGNIAALLTYAGLPSIAIKASQTALHYGRHASNQSERAASEFMSLVNIAFASLDTGQYSLGLRCVARTVGSEPYSANDESLPLLQRLYLALCARNFARLCLRVGDLDAARRHVDTVTRLASHPSACRRTVRCRELALAMLDVYSNSLERGVARIVQCLAECRAVEPGAEATYLRALVEAYVATGDIEQAEVHQRDLATFIRRTGTESMLFHHNRHLSRLMSVDDLRRDLLQSAVGRIHPLQVDPTRDTLRHRDEVLQNLGAAAELHDDPSGEHPYRVARLASLLALRLSWRGLSDELARAAVFHDIGKIAIPAEILRKRTSLTLLERETMRSHTHIGADLLQSSNLDSLNTAIAIARHHHESWDGTGYPDGLAGAAIPLAARLTAIAEAFDAMTHDRPYRPRISVVRALDTIASYSGKQFDPSLVKPFCELVHELRSRHTDLDAFLRQEAVESSSFIRAHRRLHQRLQESSGADKLIN